MGWIVVATTLHRMNRNLVLAPSRCTSAQSFVVAGNPRTDTASAWLLLKARHCAVESPLRPHRSAGRFLIYINAFPLARSYLLLEDAIDSS